MQTNTGKPNKCTKSTQTSSLFAKRDNPSAKNTKKNTRTKRKARQYKKPRRIKHEATQSKSNTRVQLFKASLA